MANLIPVIDLTDEDHPVETHVAAIPRPAIPVIDLTGDDEEPGGAAVVNSIPLMDDVIIKWKTTGQLKPRSAPPRRIREQAV
jgi:hypothetical protein